MSILKTILKAVLALIGFRIGAGAAGLAGTWFIEPTGPAGAGLLLVLILGAGLWTARKGWGVVG